MADYQGNSGADWARSMATTLQDHIREEEQAWMRNFKMFALLESRGNIVYNLGGRGFDWSVRYRTHELEGNTGETARNFARRNLNKRADLPYRGYQATDLIYEREKLENRGEAAIVNVFDNLVGRLEDSIKHGVAPEWYIDGNATGNTTLWHGLESMFGTNGTLKYDAGTQRASNQDDYVAYPSDTYAGITTGLGDYGGENETGQYWPHGVADSEFDFWSPLVVVENSNRFSPATHSWATQGDEALRFGIIHSQRNSSVDGGVDLILNTRTKYFELLNLIDGKEQINITGTNELRALGFKDTFVYDGVPVSWETAVPANASYGLPFSCIQLRCMYSNIFQTEGPEYDMDSQGYKAVVKTLSNLKFKSPRNFFKCLPYTSIT